MSWNSIINELKSHGLTEVQIAARCGCKQPTINDLANGRRANPLYPLGAALHALLREVRKAPVSATKKKND